MTARKDARIRASMDQGSPEDQIRAWTVRLGATEVLRRIEAGERMEPFSPIALFREEREEAGS